MFPRVRRLRLACSALFVELVMLALVPRPLYAERKARHIYIQPLGSGVPAEEIALIRRAITTVFGLQVRVAATKPLPPSTLIPQRLARKELCWGGHARSSDGPRYAARQLNDLLAKQRPADGLRVVGVTQERLVADGQCIGGLANDDRTACVLSLADTDDVEEGRAAGDAKQKRQKYIALLALHEFAHTLGVFHCGAADCVMSPSSDSTWKYTFCADCQAILKEHGFRVVRPDHHLWPRRPYGLSAAAQDFGRTIEHCNDTCMMECLFRPLPTCPGRTAHDKQ